MTFFFFFNAVQIESSLFFTLGFLTQAPGKGVQWRGGGAERGREGRGEVDGGRQEGRQGKKVAE